MRALVVAGEGRAFCAGADIGELDNLDGPHGFGAFVHGLTDTGREGPGGRYRRSGRMSINPR